MIHGPQHPYNSYSLLDTAVSQPFLAEKHCFSDPVERKRLFRSEMAEERLDLTSYMSYTYGESRGSPYLTTISVRTTHICRYAQPFLSRFWPKVLFSDPVLSAKNG